MAAYPCDLHTHTLRSDGNDSYRELIDNAADAGVKILAISDHDIVALDHVDVEGKNVPLAEYGAGRGLRVLRSIEFSCDTYVEDVHIVALGCDWDHPFFEEEYRASIRSKIDGYKELCELLTRHGMPLDWERDVLLDGARADHAVQRKHIFEAMGAKGYAADWSAAKLLVKTDPRFDVKRRKPDPVGIIQNIRAAGGISILAHPYLIEETPLLRGKPAIRSAYIDHLLDAGLDGMEASYPYNKTSYGGTMTPEEIETEVRELYTGRVRVLSGGSDYHNEGVKGARNPRQLGERGVTMEYFEENPLLARIQN